MIQRLVKDSGRGGEYRGVYRLRPDAGLVRPRLHTRDKTVAWQRLRAIVAEAEREDVGLIPPAQQRLSACRPLADHLAEFTAELRSVGRDSMYVRCVGTMCSCRMAGLTSWCVRRLPRMQSVVVSTFTRMPRRRWVSYDLAPPARWYSAVRVCPMFQF